MKARDFFLVGLKGAPFYTRFDSRADADSALNLLRPSNEPEIIHVIAIEDIRPLVEALKETSEQLGWLNRRRFNPCASTNVVLEKTYAVLATLPSELLASEGADE